MSTSYQTNYDTARHSQEAFAYPLEIWADWVQKFVDPAPHLHIKKPVEEAVEHYFHVLERILVIQRNIVLGVVARSTWAATKAVATAQEVAKDVHKVAGEATPKKDMHDGAREPALKKS